MKSNYQHIFTPLTVKNMTIKNRIVMMPMGTNYGEQNGEMSFLHINYYKERAKGGTGLIIVENASVDSPQGSNGTTQLRIDHDNYLPRLYKFCEEIHKYGTCIAIQINHAGASAVSARTNMQPVSASDVPSKEGGEIPRPLSVEEIHHIVKKYGEAAKEAEAAAIAQTAPAQAEENLADDGELVAVIAAAIAAAEGTTTDGFVVRSIRKVKRNRR